MIDPERGGEVAFTRVSASAHAAGLGVLVGRLKLVRNHSGWLRIVCSNDRVLRVFRITGLDKVFGIHPSVAEAVAA